jgi:hypothetical protein
MNSRGYYSSTVNYEIDTTRRPKRAYVTFRTHQGEPYYIKSLSYDFRDQQLAPIITADTARSLIRVGEIFDITVLDKERDEKHIFDLASGGFASTVRLAKSNKDMWRAIFTQNQENILTVLDNYIEKLYLFRKAIAEDNSAEVDELITEANKIKRILK